MSLHMLESTEDRPATDFQEKSLKLSSWLHLIFGLISNWSTQLIFTFSS